MCAEFATPLLARLNSWLAMQRDFRWQIPPRFNMAQACCEDWAKREPERKALIYLAPDGTAQEFSYSSLSRASNRLANAFVARGLGVGDRCAIFLPQLPETLFCHLACYKIGAVALPLFTLFGADALQYRLQNSGAKILVTDQANLPKVLQIRDSLPDLQVIYCVEGGEALSLAADMAAASDQFTMRNTAADDPALLVYTSGTTGPPKGTLHGHRVLLGHLPGIETHHEFFPQAGDCMWTPADWAWIGGLMNALMPSLYYGVPVVAHRMAKFSAEAAYELMRRFEVRNSFLPPTALKLMRQSGAPKGVSLRTVGSGGEALGAEMLEWGQGALGLTINEFYGQTECNLVLGNCAALDAPRPGSMGRAVPGATVAVIDAHGQELPAGEVGEIAVRRDHVAMFLRYWQLPEKTAEKFCGNWMRTGDLGYRDEEGYFYYSSRDDDVITSAGYRIGPTEIESCLMGDEDVVMAAVVGVPDPVKGEAVKAFVVLREGADETGLQARLIARVREKVSPHLAPRDIETIAEMPLTATGKIIRRQLRSP